MITSFSGEFDFLSNFYQLGFEFDGLWAPTAEHHFQAAKTDDAEEKARIYNAPTPAHAKRLGRKCTKRRDWEERKQQKMLLILREKFKHPVMRQQLLDTGSEELVEGNTWGDIYWGQCPLGHGENHLGKLLMQVREEIQDG